MKKLLILIAILAFTASCSTLSIQMKEFTATPQVVEKGGKTTLRWNVACTEPVSVEIVGIAKDLPAQGEMEVIMNESTTFTLLAKAKKGNGKFVSGKMSTRCEVKKE